MNNPNYIYEARDNNFLIDDYSDRILNYLIQLNLHKIDFTEKYRKKPGISLNNLILEIE
ncbi:hypothetical protein [Borreliella turdi]|uniref:hypothetical protein n=1 Tax=Borreliella turdi TaxID=57863 RepID=UPI002E19BB9A